MATSAKIYAQNEQKKVKKQLDSLYGNAQTAYKQEVAAAKGATQNVINQLNQQATDYQTQYGLDTRNAFINRNQELQNVSNTLSQLGLRNSGYGVNQNLDVYNTYNQNMTNLANTLGSNLTKVEQEKATAGTDLANTLAGLASNYQTKKSSIYQYIMGQLQDVYDKAYARRYTELQNNLR